MVFRLSMCFKEVDMRKAVQYLAMILVVVVLFAGIFSIGRRLIRGDSSSKQSAESNSGSEESETEAKKDRDNSVPMTSLTVTAPQGYLRVGKTMQLDIKTEPAEATNTELEWSCSMDGAVEVTEDGVLTPQDGFAKNTVTVTATATDGSGLTQSFELRIYPAIDPTKDMVAITFDDGPNDTSTMEILDAFEENYAVATFFCLGDHVELYPEVCKREYELGMEVASHSYSHDNTLTSLSDEKLDEIVSKGVSTIKDAIGVAPRLLRPPYGNNDARVRAVLKSYGLCCMYWSLDTEDWKTANADDTYKQVMTATDGDVVLLHDIHEYNVDAVRRFIPDLEAAGFQLVTVPELYEARGETLEAGSFHMRTDPTTESTGETTAASTADGATAESTTQAAQ